MNKPLEDTAVRVGTTLDLTYSVFFSGKYNSCLATKSYFNGSTEEIQIVDAFSQKKLWSAPVDVYETNENMKEMLSKQADQYR